MDAESEKKAAAPVITNAIFRLSFTQNSIPWESSVGKCKNFSVSQ
jgi:hypothetical protein